MCRNLKNSSRHLNERHLRGSLLQNNESSRCKEGRDRDGQTPIQVRLSDPRIWSPELDESTAVFRSAVDALALFDADLARPVRSSLVARSRIPTPATIFSHRFIPVLFLPHQKGLVIEDVVHSAGRTQKPPMLLLQSRVHCAFGEASNVDVVGRLSPGEGGR